MHILSCERNIYPCTTILLTLRPKGLCVGVFVADTLSTWLMNEPWAWICISGEALQIIAAINHTCFSSGLLSSEFIKSLFWQDEVFEWLNWPKEPHNLQRAQITVGSSCDVRAARTGAGFTLAEWLLHWVMRTRGHYYYELAWIFKNHIRNGQMDGCWCPCQFSAGPETSRVTPSAYRLPEFIPIVKLNDRLFI